MSEVIGQVFAGNFDALPGCLGANGLCELRAGFFHSQPHFERLTVRLFEFQADQFEPLLTRFEVLGIQPQLIHTSLPVFGLLFADLLPGGLIIDQSLTVAPELFLLNVLHASQQALSSIQRLFPFVQPGAVVIELSVTQLVNLLIGDSLRACLLLFEAKIGLFSFELIPQFLEMIFLKANPVLPQNAVLLQLVPIAFLLVFKLNSVVVEFNLTLRASVLKVGLKLFPGGLALLFERLQVVLLLQQFCTSGLPFLLALQSRCFFRGAVGFSLLEVSLATMIGLFGFVDQQSCMASLLIEFGQLTIESLLAALQIEIALLEERG